RLIVEQGRRESAAWGTTTIGDIAGAGAGIPDDATGCPRRVAFREVLGLPPEWRASQLERARAHLTETGSFLRGLSPHAPYSVHPDLFREVVDLAVANRVPVAMHLAETRAELELLADGTGEFAPFLKGLGVWRDDAIPRGTRPLDYLRELARVENALA